MRVFGWEITRAQKQLQGVSSGTGGWWPMIRESFTGAWQQNVEIRVPDVMTFSAVYACVTLIASDIAKMRLRLMQQDANGIWEEHDNPAYSPVLRKPNHYQTRIKFVEWWITSKLMHGNTYALKVRNHRGRAHEGNVRALYILDPYRVTVLVAPDGAVFYELKADNLSGLESGKVAVPASEIVHDVHVPLYHPLVGVTPIHACGLAAVQGLKIQHNSTRFFANGSNPGGVLTAPGTIAQTTADRLKAYWEQNFTGENVGKIAVLGDGLKYEGMTIKAVDAQLIEQLRWTAENVCTAFHVPPYMIGVGPPPNYNNIEALNQQYYSQCLQTLIESMELLLDEGLELATNLGTEFDLDDLLRMDTATLISAEKEAVGAGIKKPNESRARLNLKPVQGGDTPYLQQQNYSLAALDRRDKTIGTLPPTPEFDPTDDVGEQRAAAFEAKLMNLAVSSARRNAA